MHKPASAKRGFTLIELLTVIAILAILGAIIFPTVGQFRTLAKKTSDSNDLRNIVQASQLFAAQYGERLVGTTEQLAVDGDNLYPNPDANANDLADVAAVLAFGGELEDPKAWVSANETVPSKGGLYTFSGGNVTVNYEPDDFSFSYVTGLRTSASSNTPVAFTRQSGASGQWVDGDPYGADGGHVAFMGGNVSWYTTLTNNLISPDGAAVDTIEAAIPQTDTEIREAGTPTGGAGATDSD
ncbi:type II secretion system protein [Pelagicoccus sp. SDUM812002]|uniref:type II secretion system protein n=1 Tax=Pelagicoccus sp. SDUM812002 TaxID=3041266 RepID=UPI00280D01F9|nr:type II secretion system protein [Pelagicoccus sp. SDUM812002]MDQ8184535.1 type II secretion system protein [Pelagicoccus sp. SDUM812002]